MAEMTSHERFKRMYEHREADRVPITDSPWAGTVRRWHREGMPEDVAWQDYFGVDKVASIGVDNSPRYPEEVVEETDEHVISTTRWGQTLRRWKVDDSTPEFLDCRVVDRDTWADAKARMTPSRDRVDWDHLEKNWARWRDEGRWICGGWWFGFDVTHSWMVGTERLLIALVEDPEWCADMFNAYLDLDIALFDMIWHAGYHFDTIRWPDDLGYKHNQFMSLGMFRELVKPTMRRACEWARAHGVSATLHSCGDVTPFVPEFIDIGIHCLNPLEVKAGMDPIALKREYGDRLAFHGGLNAAIWGDFEAFEAEMRRIVPAMKEGGGYIFSSDHSVPNNVSLETFRRTVELAKELGSYE